MEKISEKEAFEKIIIFCNYRERSSKEVLIKLSSFGYDSNSSKKIINKLKTLNIINDLRFSKSFSKGKFSKNKWGKNKIKSHLIYKGIRENEIAQGLESIDNEIYLETLKSLLINKKKTIKEEEVNLKKQKIFNYLYQKGYEKNLIFNIINRYI